MCNNAVSNKSGDLIDPKDVKILALVTKVNELQANANKQEDYVFTFTKGNKNLEMWRKVKVETKVTKGWKGIQEVPSP